MIPELYERRINPPTARPFSTNKLKRISNIKKRVRDIGEFLPGSADEGGRKAEERERESANT